MADGSERDITQLLDALRAGEPAAGDRLVERIYGELHRLALQLMARETTDPTFQPTALLHEALERFLPPGMLEAIPNRAYLFGAAAQAMRQILVDRARHRNAIRRGGDWTRIPLDAVLDNYQEHGLDVCSLNDALDVLATLHPRSAQVVVMRFFGGFTMPEIANQLEVSLSTVEADFRVARAWLRQQLGPGEGNDTP